MLLQMKPKPPSGEKTTVKQEAH